MLSQKQVDDLLAMLKLLTKAGPIEFPQSGSFKQFDVKSDDGREAFIIDVNRRGKIKATKCTYQERYQVVEILLRLDVDGPPHENPDGTVVPCPHMHVYREGYAAHWAFPLEPAVFTDTGPFADTQGIPGVLQGPKRP